jgi:hypothetical protein
MTLDVGHYSSACISYNQEGSTLVIGFNPADSPGPGKVYLWDLEARSLLGDAIPVEGAVESLATSPDGKTLAVVCGPASEGADRGVVMLLDFGSESLRRQACLVANRNLSPGEWRQYIGRDVPYSRTFPELPPGEDIPGIIEINRELMDKDASKDSLQNDQGSTRAGRR